MTDKELKVKLKRRQEYYTDTRNRLLSKIDELKEAIELEKILQDFETEIAEIVSLFVALNNNQWAITFLKEKIQGTTLKCCNCGVNVDNEFVYCEVCLDKSD